MNTPGDTIVEEKPRKQKTPELCLIAIQAACALYDKKSAKDTLAFSVSGRLEGKLDNSGAFVFAQASPQADTGNGNTHQGK